MQKKLWVLWAVMFFALNGCLYSCNYAPRMQTYKNTDPCDAGKNANLVQFVSVMGESGQIDISLVMLLPCSAVALPPNFSLAFYNAHNMLQPADLTNAVFPEWSMKQISCENPEDNQGLIDLVNKNTGLKAISEGAAVTLGVGAQHPNRLYPYYIKIPMSNPNAVGTPHETGVTEGACANGVNMSPFVQDATTLSPVYQNAKPVSVEGEEVSLALYPRQLVPMTAPLFTYGTKKFSAGSGQGLISIPGQVTTGSFFSFSVKLKPGQYYVVLSKVNSPMGAMTGDFSLSDVKIYGKGATKGMLDYVKDCNKDIRCGGKATAITV